MGLSHQQNLECRQKTDQKLMQTQHMQLALKVLCMSSDELESFMEQSVQDNPALFMKKSRMLPFADVLGVSEKKSLYVHLMEQAREIFTGQDFLDAEYIIGNIDEKGFFQENSAPVDRVLKKIQDFHPKGIAQKSAREALLYQLPRSFVLERCILQKHYEDFLHKRLDVLAKNLGRSQEEIKESFSRIQKCHPFPGFGFSTEKTAYVNTEISVNYANNKWVFQLADIPVLSISQEKDLSCKQVKEAAWLVQTIHRRQNLLIQAAKFLVSKQYLYLLQKDSEISPLTLGEVAEELEIHLSTASRLLSNKYIKTPLGVLKFSHFFTQKSFGRISREKAKKILKKLLNIYTDSCHPSDRILKEKLEQQGVYMARRTVAKYRKEIL